MRDAPGYPLNNTRNRNAYSSVLAHSRLLQCAALWRNCSRDSSLMAWGDYRLNRGQSYEAKHNPVVVTDSHDS